MCVRTTIAILALSASSLAWADDAPSCEPETLQVATLNTWGLPFPLSRSRKARFEKIQDYLDEGFDAVGLQEVWMGARGLLSHQIRLPGEPGDSGLALVTRFGSDQPQLTPFKRASGPDRWKSKGVLSTRVKTEAGTDLWLVVTHLQAGRGQRAAEVRASQVDQTLEVVRQLPGPAVVMGDFNLYDDLADDKGSIGRIRSAGWHDVAETLDQADATYPGEAARLDRMYLRDGNGASLRPQTVSVGSDAWLSDHAPVGASLQLCGTTIQD